MHGLSSIAAISMLMIFAYWCYKEFGLLTSIVVCISFVGYRYFAPIGSGLSNSAFSCLFALGMTTILLMREDSMKIKTKWWAECIIIFFAIMLKAMMGMNIYRQ